MRIKADKRFPLTTADVDFVVMCEEQGIDRKCYTCKSFYVCMHRDLNQCGKGLWDKYSEDTDFLNKIEKHEKSIKNLFKRINKENKEKKED